MYEITSKREMPSSPAWAKYPFNQMREGDSFFVPDGNKSKIASAASWAGTRHGVIFRLRRITENGKVGFAVFHCGARKTRIVHSRAAE